MNEVADNSHLNEGVSITLATEGPLETAEVAIVTLAPHHSPGLTAAVIPTPLSDEDATSGEKRSWRLLPDKITLWWKRHPRVIAIVALLGIAAVCGVALATQKARPRESASKVEDDDSAGSFDSGYYDFLFDLLVNNTTPTSSLALLTDPTSHQQMALDWLVYMDSFDLRGLELKHVLQRYALVQLYFATGGDDFWDKKWLDPELQECDFEGVTCSTDDLTVLKLDLEQRALVGRIPNDFGLLTNLRVLNLRSNRLEGSIPNEIYTQLTDLEQLDLGYNELVGILHDIKHLENLTWLALDYNFLSGPLPPIFPPRLEHVFLTSNLLHGPLERIMLPMEANFTYTETEADSFTEEMAQQSVDRIVPSSFSSLTYLRRLRVLDIGDNPITGTIPTLIGELTSLSALGLYSTSIDGTLPTEVGRLPLEGFVLSHTDVTGTIPMEFWTGAEKLRTLSMYFVPIGGSLPTEIGRLTQLERLNLMDTDIGGTIPTEVGLLSNSLEFFQAAYTSLSGTVPSELGQLTLLRTIWLQSTRLVGSVPEQVCQIPAAIYDFRTDCQAFLQCDCCTHCT